mgnify:CR=1 FL=1
MLPPADAEALSSLSRICFTQTFGHLYDPTDLAVFLDEAYTPDVLRAELADPDRATWLLFEGTADEAGVPSSMTFTEVSGALSVIAASIPSSRALLTDGSGESPYIPIPTRTMS